MRIDFDKYADGNPEKAIEFLKKACILKSSHAAHRLGVFYRDGKYVTAAKTKALDLFYKSLMWSVNSKWYNDCCSDAIIDIRNSHANNEQIVNIENSQDFTKADTKYFLNRFYIAPFYGVAKEIIDELLEILSLVFRNDISFEWVNDQISLNSYQMFDDKNTLFINSFNSMRKLYPKLCSVYNANPKVLNVFNVVDLYPYASLDMLSKICEDVVTMFLSLRNTQDPALLNFSFSSELHIFLDNCDVANDTDLQSFMLSVLEVDTYIENSISDIRDMYKYCLYEKYDNLICMLERTRKYLSPTKSNLNFDINNFEKIIPFNMFDEAEKNDCDEFEILLKEFLDSQVNEDANFDKKVSSNGQIPVGFSISKVNIGYDNSTDEKVYPSMCTHFRKSDDAHLHLNIFIDNPSYNIEDWMFDADFELVSDGGIVLSRIHINEFIESDEGVYMFSLSVNNLVLSEGRYTLKIICGDVNCFSEVIHIVDIPKPYTKCLNLGLFSIYRINNSDEDDEDSYSIGNHDCQSCFNIEGLSGISILTYAENIIPKSYPYQFILRIYNEIGVEIFSQSKEDIICEYSLDDKSFQFFEQIRRDDWEKGTYKVEVEFFAEVVVSAEFVIGGRDIIAIYHKNSVQPKTNIAGRGIVEAVENPLAILNAMVGLEDVKRDINLLVSKAKFDKIRQMNDLKTKPISLHAAFLGNPGTGKTTLAKLLGQIYKDMGLLSKGHVVVEERSTLCGQNWNSECDLTNKALEKAKGGILLIDEAYDLVTDHPQDPGRLVISTLLTSLADESKRDWMLILAGYPAPMEKMLNVNDGFRSRLQKFHFKDFDKQELLQIADSWLEQNDYIMTKEARMAFESIIATAASQKDKHFGNGRFVRNLLEKEIVSAMSTRLVTSGAYDSIEALKTIEYSDIPNANKEDECAISITKLENMVGLNELKGKINTHLNFVRFVNMRRDMGIATTIPPLHMIFTGNPGTGKTTVADYLGEIYKSMGLLSIGRVIKVSRADMIGRYGDTENTMQTLLSTAKGNVLFIDEAYALFNNDNPSDPGKRAVEMLLDTLGKESIDMIVIMAGYSKEMDQLLNSNPGLTGRFPYRFDFEDYSVDDLMKIAEGVCDKNNLILSDQAKEAILAIIKKECRVKDANFSNARFVVRLITTQIMPNMGGRIAKILDNKDELMLKTVLLEDVPIAVNEVKQINNNLFNEEAIKRELDKLDSLVGLTKVKKAIHEFVKMSRVMSIQNKKFIGSYPLKWSFAGNTGTGKSTVAEILSEILKAMYLLGKGHLVEVRAEELYAVNTHQADELLKRRMRESQQGLLFIDGDATQFRSPESRYNPDYLRMCLAANTVEMPGTYAIVIAEHESPRQQLVQSLAQIGITDFDHTLVFEDYTHDELLEILKVHLSKNNLTLDQDAEAIMRNYIFGLSDGRRCDYANARTMKLLARSIHKLALISESNRGIITYAHVSDFASLRSLSSNTKIGY